MSAIRRPIRPTSIRVLSLPANRRRTSSAPVRILGVSHTERLTPLCHSHYMRLKAGCQWKKMAQKKMFTICLQRNAVNMVTIAFLSSETLTRGCLDQSQEKLALQQSHLGLRNTRCYTSLLYPSGPVSVKKYRLSLKKINICI